MLNNSSSFSVGICERDKPLSISLQNFQHPRATITTIRRIHSNLKGQLHRYYSMFSLIFMVYFVQQLQLIHVCVMLRAKN